MANSFFDWTSSLTRFVKFDAARAEDINTALDSVSSGFEDVETKTNAAIKVPDGESLSALPAAVTRKGKLLSFNSSTGAPEATISSLDIAQAEAYAAAAGASASAASSSASSAAGSSATAQSWAQQAAAAAYAVTDYGFITSSPTDNLDYGSL